MYTGWVLGNRSILLTGVLSLLGLVFYFRALSEDDASSVIILFQMIPVLGLIFSFLFLGEIISLKQFIGFVVVLLAAMRLSAFDEHEHVVRDVNNILHWKKKKGIHFSRAFYLMLGADIAVASSNVLIKFASQENSFTDILIYESLGMFLGGLMYYGFAASARASFHEKLLKVGTTVLGMK